MSAPVLTADYNPPRLTGPARLAMTAGVIGAVLCVIGAYVPSLHDEFYRAYLWAYLFWTNVAIGSLVLLMIQHLSGGAWGIVTRRILEASSRTIIFMLVLFIPVALGIKTLYEWSDPSRVSHDSILKLRKDYMTPGMFCGRAVLYFVIWGTLAGLLSKLSLQQDRTGDPLLAGRMRNISGPGLVIYAITMTLAVVDWLMSLDSHWYSTIFAPVIGIGQVLGAMAFTIAVLILLSQTKPLCDVVQPDHLHDLGKLMLAFVMLWAYLSFSQLLIIWSGNLTEEIPWYLRRMRHGWQYMGIALILFHFALPFCLLLSRSLKRNSKQLILVALLVIVMRMIDLFFIVTPSTFHGTTPHEDVVVPIQISWLHFAAIIGVGGIWISLFLHQLSRRPLIPVNEPFLKEALAQHGGH